MLFLVVVSISAVWFVLANQSQTTDLIKTYFAYPASDKLNEGYPEKKIIDLIDALEKGDSLSIAMYSFTDDDLGKAVRDAFKREVKVRVYLEKSRICREGAEFTDLKKEGIEVRGDKYGEESYLMHHKFAILNTEDERIVITGSYNWSSSADTDNYENLLVISDKETFSEYKEIFTDLWNNYSISLQKLNCKE